MMTVREAREILRRPRFGDESSLRARDLIELAEGVNRVRDCFAPVEGIRDIDSMTAQDLRHELAIWEAAGCYDGEELEP